jgi:hypothetical protein
VLTLPAIDKKIVSSKVPTRGEARVVQDASGIRVAVPAAFRHDIGTVIGLELDGPASDVAPLNMK